MIEVHGSVINRYSSMLSAFQRGKMRTVDLHQPDIPRAITVLPNRIRIHTGFHIRYRVQ